MFGLHYLTHKPILELFTTQKTLFLQLLQAEGEGLITISIHPPTELGLNTSQVFLRHLSLLELYMPSKDPSLDPNPACRLSYDLQRMTILHDCIERHLLPNLEKETRRELIRLSRQAIMEECSLTFQKMLRVGPYRPSHITTKDVLLNCPEKAASFSVACLYVSSIHQQNALCMAFLNPLGVLIAQSVVPQEANTQKRERIRSFLYENRPNVIVINASGGETSRSMANMIRNYLLSEISAQLLQGLLCFFVVLCFLVLYYFF